MKMLAMVAVLALAGLFATGVAQERQIGTAPTGNTAHPGHEMMLTGDMSKDMQMMNEMMVKHLGTKGADFEKRFIDMMVSHHEGAILMAKQALKEAGRPELKEMAVKMIKEQGKEIEQLKKWREAWYGQSSATQSTSPARDTK